MQDSNVIVRFDMFCHKCKHKDLPGHKDPCNECLENPVNINSIKPVFFEEDEKFKSKEAKK